VEGMPGIQLETTFFGTLPCGRGVGVCGARSPFTFLTLDEGRRHAALGRAYGAYGEDGERFLLRSIDEAVSQTSVPATTMDFRGEVEGAFGDRAAYGGPWKLEVVVLPAGPWGSSTIAAFVVRGDKRLNPAIPAFSLPHLMVLLEAAVPTGIMEQVDAEYLLLEAARDSRLGIRFPKRVVEVAGGGRRFYHPEWMAMKVLYGCIAGQTLAWFLSRR